MIWKILGMLFGWKRNTSESKKFRKFSKEAQMQMLKDFNEKT